MMNLNKRTMAGLAVLGVVIAVILYLLFPLGMVQYLTDKQRLLAVIKEHRANAAFIFIGLQVLQVVAAPVPGEVTGFVWGVLLSTVGLTLGSWLAFVLARFAGRPLVETFVNPETIKRYDYVMKHKGMFLAFLMFLIPGFPKDLLCYLLGLGHMRQRDFLIVSTIGRLLGTMLLTMGGTLFRDQRYAAFFSLAGISIALILFTMIYRENIERWFRGMRLTQHLKARSERTQRKKRTPR